MLNHFLWEPRPKRKYYQIGFVGNDQMRIIFSAVVMIEDATSISISNKLLRK